VLHRAFANRKFAWCIEMIPFPEVGSSGFVGLPYGPGIFHKGQDMQSTELETVWVHLDVRIVFLNYTHAHKNSIWPLL
jgi:hypothetical protein